MKIELMPEQKASLKRCLAVLGLVLAASLLFSSSFAAPTATPSSLCMGKSAMVQKKYAMAVKHFESAVKTDPSSCECRLWLGKSLCKMATTLPKGSTTQNQNFRRGAQELRKAIRLGKGSTNAIEANTVLLKLPRYIIAPKIGGDTSMIALANGISGRERGTEAAKPKVLEFYASWCEPCKQLQQVMEKAKTTYGDRVEFLSYNVDDPSAEKIIEDYEVSPIPTLIFLDPSNQVVSYAIGYSGETGLQQGMKKILPN